MLCPSCRAETLPSAASCGSCGRSVGGLVPGTLFASRYEILASLGRGGMGVVYKARDRELDEVVALKVLRPDVAGTPEMERRFLSEIKLARRVSHRNVCRLHDYGSAEGQRYVCMAYVEGVDLKRVLASRGALPSDGAYDVCAQVADGLQAIHRFPRPGHLELLRGRLRRFPVVALLGARQVGKTTLAREIARGFRGKTTFFDLERAADLSLLADPELALRPLARPRPLPGPASARRPPAPPALVSWSWAARLPCCCVRPRESLAGRISFHELPGLSLAEVGSQKLDRLWLRGGFPRSFTARTGGESVEWRREFVRTFLERAPARLCSTLRFSARPARAPRSAAPGRFWAMLAHAHGNVWNGSRVRPCLRRRPHRCGTWTSCAAFAVVSCRRGARTWRSGR